MKFSIIIPVYKVEDYIEKCLQSIDKQSYQNYEAIIVNDGSPDNSEKIIKKFINGKKKFKYFKKENGGLSDARNFGVTKATGDYLLFIDSDDYISVDLLKKLDEEISKTAVDVIKYGCNLISNPNGVYKNYPFSKLNFDDAINYLIKDDALEPACIYCYKKVFWIENKFQFAKGRIHEDFGLIPLVLMNAKSLSSITYKGYNYVIRENSIMTLKDEEKDYKKFMDKVYFFDTNIPLIEKNVKNIKARNLLRSFYANCLIHTTKSLSKANRKKAIKEIKIRKLDKYLLDDTFKRKVKKILFKLSNSLYIKYWIFFV